MLTTILYSFAWACGLLRDVLLLPISGSRDNSAFVLDRKENTTVSYPCDCCAGYSNADIVGTCVTTVNNDATIHCYPFS